MPYGERERSQLNMFTLKHVSRPFAAALAVAALFLISPSAASAADTQTLAGTWVV